jgi:hypothetical protein
VRRRRPAYEDVESLATLRSGDLSGGRTAVGGQTGDLCVGTVLCRRRGDADEVKEGFVMALGFSGLRDSCGTTRAFYTVFGCL